MAVELRSIQPGHDPGTGPAAAGAAARRARQGNLAMWVSFAFCPCHLPITLWVLGTLFAGTALGAAVRANPVVAGIVVTAVWVAGTSWGWWRIRTASCPLPAGRRRSG